MAVEAYCSSAVCCVLPQRLESNPLSKASLTASTLSSTSTVPLSAPSNVSQPSSAILEVLNSRSTMVSDEEVSRLLAGDNMPTLHDAIVAAYARLKCSIQNVTVNQLALVTDDHRIDPVEEMADELPELRAEVQATVEGIGEQQIETSGCLRALEGQAGLSTSSYPSSLSSSSLSTLKSSLKAEILAELRPQMEKMMRETVLAVMSKSVAAEGGGLTFTSSEISKFEERRKVDAQASQRVNSVIMTGLPGQQDGEAEKEAAKEVILQTRAQHLGGQIFRATRLERKKPTSALPRPLRVIFYGPRAALKLLQGQYGKEDLFEAVQGEAEVQQNCLLSSSHDANVPLGGNTLAPSGCRQ